MPSHHRIARLLEMITLIRHDTHLRAKDLAEHFGISRKRVFDDIEDLNIAGVPVVFDNEGYRILPGFFLPPTNLSVEEALTLVLAIHLMEESGGLPSRVSAPLLAAKAIAWMRESDQRVLSEISSQLLQETPRRPPRKSSVIQTVALAAAEHRSLRVTYTSLTSHGSDQRTLDPYALAYRKNAWYVIGFCHRRAEIRTFKLGRFEHATLLKQKFARPGDFSLQKYLGNTWGIHGGEDFAVRIRFSSEIVPLIREKSFPNGHWEAEQDSGTILTARAASQDEVLWWVLQYGSQAEVLSPPNLRLRMQQEVARMREIYDA